MMTFRSNIRDLEVEGTQPLLNQMVARCGGDFHILRGKRDKKTRGSFSAEINENVWRNLSFADSWSDYAADQSVSGLNIWTNICWRILLWTYSKLFREIIWHALNPSTDGREREQRLRFPQRRNENLRRSLPIDWLWYSVHIGTEPQNKHLNVFSQF